MSRVGERHGRTGRVERRPLTQVPTEGHSGVEYSPHRRVQARARRSARAAGARAGGRARLSRARRSPSASTTTRITAPVARALFLGGYLGWPPSGASSKRNVAHVLGLPADRPGRRAPGARHLRHVRPLRAGADAPAAWRPWTSRCGCCHRSGPATTPSRRSGSAARRRAGASSRCPATSAASRSSPGAYALQGCRPTAWPTTPPTRSCSRC